MNKLNENSSQTNPMVIHPEAVQYILRKYGASLFPIGTILKFEDRRDADNPYHATYKTGVVNGQGITCNHSGMFSHVPVWCEEDNTTVMVSLWKIIAATLPTGYGDLPF